MTTRAKPEPRERYAHFVTITTRLMDNDIYNHVNNATYYSFIDTAVTSYLANALGRDLGRDAIAYFTVENGCNYFSPIAFPNVVHCGLRVAHVGKSSMRFEIGLFRNDEPLAAAQGWFVQVTCDRSTQRPIDMPPRVREALEAIRMP
ncbi:MAG TPA: thioesterase family protein [Burkholderiales bacterium]|nr:thioesterase family protein [Burkholderiales bacterium]